MSLFPLIISKFQMTQYGRLIDSLTVDHGWEILDYIGVKREGPNADRILLLPPPYVASALYKMPKLRFRASLAVSRMARFT